MLAAAHAHRDFAVPLDQPIDVFSVIEQEGILLAFEPFPNLSGAYIVERGTQRGIVVNANHPQARQRYTAAHELGHHRLGHGTSVDPEVEPLSRWGSRSLPDNEKVAEAFAAWFLMPRRLVSHCLAGLGLDRPESADDAYQLALRLGTSYEATVRHLPNLRFATRGATNEWLRVAPARLKERAGGAWVPTNLRSDLFAIKGRDNGTRLIVRPGDRLLCAFPEIPSSGYTWESRTVPEGFELLDDFYEAIEDSPEVAGAAATRVFAYGVTGASVPVDSILELRKARPWNAEEYSERFSLDVLIAPPRRGVDQSLLRLAG